MKIFTSAQIHELDHYTIEHEPIRSIDLMERAAKALTRSITDSWTNMTPVVVFAGPGNNGGDALAVARMLAEQNYKVSVYLFNVNGRLSEDCAKNQQRIIDNRKIKNFTEVRDEFDPPQLEANMLVIDGLFGSGLNKPLAGGFASLVKYINQSPSYIISIDVPSGLMTEDNTYNVRANIIKADTTLTLQQKKLSFLFPENQQFIGKLKILDIRLSEEGIKKIEAQYTMAEETDIRNMMRKRNVFAHKGEMGTALIIAGSYGMAGASVLATKACLRTGAGKVIAHTPRRNNDIMQISIPEAIISIDNDEKFFSEAISAEDIDAVCLGPGLRQQENTAIALITQIRRSQCPTVLDADALNILSNHRAWTVALVGFVLAFCLLQPHWKSTLVCSGASLAFAFAIVLISAKIISRNAVLSYCGRHLFSLYILQRLPMVILQKTAFAKAHKYGYFLVCLAATFVIAAVFDYVVPWIWGLLTRLFRKIPFRMHA